MKADDAQSDTYRKGVHDWYSGTLSSRLDNPKEGAIILVAQRLHVDDLIGHVVDSAHWEVLELPAIARKRQFIDIGAEIPWEREPGEFLDGDRMGQEELDRMRFELGSYFFEAQYQQDPQTPDGNLIKMQWFNRYSDAERPKLKDCDRVVQSWDTASVPGEGNSYSVCTTWGVLGERLYLLDVFRMQLDYPALRKAVIQQREKYGAETVVVEDAQSGVSLFQDLRSEEHFWIKKIKPEGDKETRAAHQSAKIEQGWIYLPEAADWLEDYEKELAQFPHAKHDDQIDSTTQFLRLLDVEKKPEITVTYIG